jgi:uncharacterized protein (DUF362 family)
MTKAKVAIVRYEQPLESVRRAVDLCDGLGGLPTRGKVFIKPNIVFWTQAAAFPKWGVITTSRVVEDMVKLLKERGIDDITIGEGTVLYDPKDRDTPRHAFETLGYLNLGKKYGVKAINVFERPFEKVDLGDGVQLNFNADVLESDFLVNVPVLKTHAQTKVSLGIKNLKGLIDIPSRKKCHAADPTRDLNFMIARLADKMPPNFTILDGIYTNERGPSFDGKIRRSNILVASSDIFATDLVGAKILGFEPDQVPHLAHAARNRGRSTDLSDVEVHGEKIEELTLGLQYTFAYNDTGTLPKPMEKLGIKGLSYPKYDLSLCTYCSILTGVVLGAIAMAWKGESWDEVEVLTGKVMKPSEQAKKTILIGKCMYEANKDHPRIGDFISVKTCPPSPKAVTDALIAAGIPVNPQIIQHPEMAPVFFMPRYAGKPEFDESLFTVSGE